MSLGVNLADLGLDLPTNEQAARRAPATVANAARTGLVPGSPLAQVLYQVWSGRPIVSVPSPPGAGKTTLVVDVVSQLFKRSDRRIVVTTPTRRGAFELAAHLATILGCTPAGDARVVIGMRIQPHEELHQDVGKSSAASGKRAVVVRTLASCTSSPPTCDLMVMDEAYQTVFADAAHAAEGAAQVLLVGDPGQIDPVEQSDTTVWSTMKAGPQMRAPEVFVQAPDAFEVRLPSTFRIGPAAAAAIAPLYDFKFDSLRPDRYVVGPDGRRLPEIGSELVATNEDGEFDLTMLGKVAHAAAGFVGAELHETQPDGSITSRLLEAGDVAVVIARSGQEAAVSGMLRRHGPGYEDVVVGTADRLQGGQWAAVVALDPLVGADSADDFRAGPGRLCVMASRQTHRLVWFHDDRWNALLQTAAKDEANERRRADAIKGLQVRRALTR